MRRVLLPLSMLFLLANTSSMAQTCLGMASFANGRVQVAPSVAFDDGATNYGASVGYGAPRSFYGAVGFSTTEFDGINASADNLNLAVGYQVPLRSGRAEVCPVASLGLGWGPNGVLAPGVDISSRTIAAGAAFGIVVGGGSSVQLVPNASLLLASTRLTADDGTDSVSDSEGYAALTLGTGLVFGSRYSLNPSVTMAFGLGDVDPTFGLALGIHFGR